MITNETIRFLRELEANNTKAWFDENRRRYEREVKDPFRAFCGAILDRLQQADVVLPGLAAETIASFPADPRDGIMRINRDLRFSKNKTPYHTYLRVAFVPNGRKSGNPGLYVTIEPEVVGAGGGVYRAPRAYPPGLPRLERVEIDPAYRAGIDQAHDHGLRAGAPLVAIVGSAPERFVGMEDQVGWVLDRFAEVSPLIGALL